MAISAQQQLAFQIFNDIGISGGKITDSPVEISFGKSNQMIDLTDLSLVARKSLNAALYIASKFDPVDHNKFVVPMDFFKWLINYDKSNNISHLKKSMIDAQKSSIQVQIVGQDENNDEWASVPLLGTTVIGKGQVMFKIPEEVLPHIKNPKSFTMLSIRISSALTTQYALNMYEKLSATLFRKGTDWMAVDEVREYFGAKGVKTLENYADFKRYVLIPSINQINDVTDISVIMETRASSGTKRITHLKFNVSENPNGSMSLITGIQADLKELYDILTREFGLSTENLNEIMLNRSVYTDSRIKNAIHFTRDRIKKKTDIKFPGLYLMKAIKDGYKLSEAELAGLSKEEQATVKTAKKKGPSPQELAAEAYVKSLTSEELQFLLSKVAEESADNTLLVNEIHKKGLSSKLVQVTVNQHVIKHSLY